MTVALASTSGSTIFSTDGNYNRGCAMRIKLDTQSGLGCQLIGSSTLPSSETDPFIITGFSFGKEEGISITKCFNDKNFVYTFGDSLEQSILSVKVVGMLGNNSTVLSTLKSFYTDNRISNKNAGILTLNYGSATSTLQGFLLGISSNIISADFLLQSFDLRLLMVDFFSGSGGGANNKMNGGYGSKLSDTYKPGKLLTPFTPKGGF